MIIKTLSGAIAICLILYILYKLLTTDLIDRMFYNIKNPKTFKGGKDFKQNKSDLEHAEDDLNRRMNRRKKNIEKELGDIDKLQKD